MVETDSGRKTHPTYTYIHSLPHEQSVKGDRNNHPHYHQKEPPHFYSNHFHISVSTVSAPTIIPYLSCLLQPSLFYALFYLHINYPTTATPPTSATPSYAAHASTKQTSLTNQWIHLFTTRNYRWWVQHNPSRPKRALLL